MNLKRTKKLNKKHSLHIAITFIWYIIDLFIDSFFYFLLLLLFLCLVKMMSLYLILLSAEVFFQPLITISFHISK